MNSYYKFIQGKKSDRLLYFFRFHSPKWERRQRNIMDSPTGIFESGKINKELH